MSIKVWMLLIGFSLGMVITGVGAYLLLKPMPFDKTTSAEVTSATCANNKCTVVMKFVDSNDSIYNKQAIVSSSVKKGDRFTILYDSKNPNNFYPGNPPVRIVGGLIASLGLFLIIGVLIMGFVMYRAYKSTSSYNQNYMTYSDPYATKSYLDTHLSSTTPSLTPSTQSTV